MSNIPEIPYDEAPIPSNTMKVLDANTRSFDEFMNSEGELTQDRNGDDYPTRKNLINQLTIVIKEAVDSKTEVEAAAEHILSITQGPAGKDGKNGKDGKDGKDGVFTGGTVPGGTNFIGKLQQDGSDVITKKTIGMYQKGLGINQTWQNVASSRKIGTNYTNNTDNPISIKINLALNGSNGGATLYIDNIKLDYDVDSSYVYTTFNAIIPPNSIYKIVGNDTFVKIITWTELR